MQTADQATSYADDDFEDPAWGDIYRLKYEDRELEPIEDYDVIHSREEALDALEQLAVDPDPSLGSAYVTEDDGEEERIIAGRYFWPRDLTT
jgi:hypothetical protein